MPPGINAPSSPLLAASPGRIRAVVTDFERYAAWNPVAVLEHRERFTGMPVPLYRRGRERDITRGFEGMNGALKASAAMPGAG